MSRIKHMIAFDCSNASVRTILGRFDGTRIETEILAQAANGMIRANGYFYWDILGIYRNMMEGLSLAAQKVEKIDSIGICTWGVDFAAYTKEKAMLGNPLAYRNTLGEEAWRTTDEVAKTALFNETGILCDKINTVFMLKALKNKMPSLLQNADKLLIVPDIFNYMLTGVMQNEPSEFSTTQLMDVRTGLFSEAACEEAGVTPDLFPERGVHGQKIGNLLSDIRREAGIKQDVPVICVPSHDTASAILAIPAEEKDFAFISSGTWGLIGSEEDKPIINDQVKAAALTNEIGAFGKITLLKNNAGMFIVQRLRKEYDPNIGWEDFYRLSDEAKDPVPLIDVNDSAFFNPPHMGQAIWRILQEAGKLPGAAGGLDAPDYRIILKSFLLSMAESYKTTILELEKVCGKTFDKLYIVGGGAKNHRLCQIAADRTGKTVVTGSSESTSMGNICAQLKYFYPELTIVDLRQIAKNSIETKVYQPTQRA